MTILILFLLYAIVLSVLLGRRGVHSPARATSTVPRELPERVLIIGATGGSGRQLVNQALERGCVVTAFVRDASHLGIEHPQLTIARGDVRDADSLAAAMQGQEAVLCALGHRQLLGPSRILSEGTQNILRAMESAHVSRLVCETSLGIGDSAGRLGLSYTFFILPVVLPFYFWDKTRQERIIEASKADWTIVRPAALTNGERRGTFQHGAHIGSFLFTAKISRADVADFMLRQLTSDEYHHAAPGVCW